MFPAPELLLGMGLAQVIATFHVYAFNRRLFNQMAAVAAAGFLPVPNPVVMPGLLRVESAFWGGLLFTLSVGAGLALLSVAVAALWPGRASQPRWAVVLPAVLQAGLLVCMNSRGVEPWVSLYFIIVPPAVFWMARRFIGRADRPLQGRFWLWRALPLAALALGWATQYDRSLFIDLRDHLLMSNPAGQQVSSFYYRYTLYPAEVFKSLDQKLIKTVAWPDADARHEAVRQVLIRYDYLPVGAGSDADLGLRMDGDHMVFTRLGHSVLETTTGRFLSDPRAVLTEISTLTDLWSPFRAFTFYGVLLAFPIALYVLLFAGLRFAFGIVAGVQRADVLCAGACLLIGLGLLGHFHFSRLNPPRPEELAATLGSTAWQVRVSALKEIRERKLDVCAFPGYENMLRSPYPQERYWLALALAASPSPSASADLTRLLDDPHINVRTQALEALAQRKDRAAAGQIRKLLKTSPDWYDQPYAYRALRTLGWSQALSH